MVQTRRKNGKQGNNWTRKVIKGGGPIEATNQLVNYDKYIEKEKAKEYRKKIIDILGIAKNGEKNVYVDINVTRNELKRLLSEYYILLKNASTKNKDMTVFDNKSKLDDITKSFNTVIAEIRKNDSHANHKDNNLFPEILKIDGIQEWMNKNQTAPKEEEDIEMIEMNGDTRNGQDTKQRETNAWGANDNGSNNVTDRNQTNRPSTSRTTPTLTLRPSTTSTPRTTTTLTPRTSTPRTTQVQDNPTFKLNRNLPNTNRTTQQNPRPSSATSNNVTVKSLGQNQEKTPIQIFEANLKIIDKTQIHSQYGQNYDPNAKYMLEKAPGEATQFIESLDNLSEIPNIHNLINQNSNTYGQEFRIKIIQNLDNKVLKLLTPETDTIDFEQFLNLLPQRDKSDFEKSNAYIQLKNINTVNLTNETVSQYLTILPNITNLVKSSKKLDAFFIIKQKAINAAILDNLFKNEKGENAFNSALLQLLCKDNLKHNIILNDAQFQQKIINNLTADEVTKFIGIFDIEKCKWFTENRAILDLLRLLDDINRFSDDNSVVIENGLDNVVNRFTEINDQINTYSNETTRDLLYERLKTIMITILNKYDTNQPLVKDLITLLNTKYHIFAGNVYDIYINNLKFDTNSIGRAHAYAEINKLDEKRISAMLNINKTQNMEGLKLLSLSEMKTLREFIEKKEIVELKFMNNNIISKLIGIIQGIEDRINDIKVSTDVNTVNKIITDIINLKSNPTLENLKNKLRQQVKETTDLVKWLKIIDNINIDLAFKSELCKILINDNKNITFVDVAVINDTIKKLYPDETNELFRLLDEKTVKLIDDVIEELKLQSIESFNYVINQLKNLTKTNEKLTAIKTNIEAAKQLKDKQDAERLEAERLEAERLKVEKEKAERLEAERLKVEKEKAERLEAERLLKEKSNFENKPFTYPTPELNKDLPLPVPGTISGSTKIVYNNKNSWTKINISTAESYTVANNIFNSVMPSAILPADIFATTEYDKELQYYLDTYNKLLDLKINGELTDTALQELLKINDSETLFEDTGKLTKISRPVST
jgi:hypothetical protein